MEATETYDDGGRSSAFAYAAQKRGEAPEDVEEHHGDEGRAYGSDEEYPRLALQQKI